MVIDSFQKDITNGLLGSFSIGQSSEFFGTLHVIGEEAWIAGSIMRAKMPGLGAAGMDVICVWGAACTVSGALQRFGSVTATTVSKLLPIS